MPFIATWMDLEIIILSEISQAENNKYHDVTYMCNLERKDTNELTYKIDSQTQKTNLWLPKGKEGDKSGIWD